MDEKENIRVDLLKFRRKAYLSYPEGSNERKTFLKVILENELRHTENDVPPEFMDLILAGSAEVLKSTLKEVFILFGICVLCSFLFVEMWPKIHYLDIIFLVGGAGCLISSGLKIKDYFRYRKNMGIIEKHANDVKKQMNRISNDIKRLEGPHGF